MSYFKKRATFATFSLAALLLAGCEKSQSVNTQPVRVAPKTDPKYEKLVDCVGKGALAASDESVMGSDWHWLRFDDNPNAKKYPQSRTFDLGVTRKYQVVMTYSSTFPWRDGQPHKRSKHFWCYRGSPESHLRQPDPNSDYQDLQIVFDGNKPGLPMLPKDAEYKNQFRGHPEQGARAEAYMDKIARTARACMAHRAGGPQGGGSQ